jgi:hypothetical protein
MCVRAPRRLLAATLTAGAGFRTCVTVCGPTLLRPPPLGSQTQAARCRSLVRVCVRRCACVAHGLTCEVAAAAAPAGGAPPSPGLENQRAKCVPEEYGFGRSAALTRGCAGWRFWAACCLCWAHRGLRSSTSSTTRSPCRPCVPSSRAAPKSPSLVRGVVLPLSGGGTDGAMCGSGALERVLVPVGYCGRRTEARTCGPAVGASRVCFF